MVVRENEHGVAHFGLILVVIAVLAIIGGAFYYVSKKNNDKSSSNQSVVSEQSLSIDEFLSKVKSNILATSIDKLSSLEKLSPKDDFSSIIVLDKDGSPVTANTDALQMKFSGKTPDVKSNVSEFSSYIKEIPQIEELDRQIAKTAEENGLEPDSINTRKDTPEAKLLNYEESVINYSGYKNADFICVLGEPFAEYGGEGSVSGVAEYLLTFGCIEQNEYDKQYDLQKQLRDAYNSHPDIKKFATDEKIANETVIAIEKQEGSFIYGSTGGLTGGGGYAVWKNENGEWKYLFGGQDTPNCKLTDGEGIPEDFFTECYDESISDIRKIKISP